MKVGNNLIKKQVFDIYQPNITGYLTKVKKLFNLKAL